MIANISHDRQLGMPTWRIISFWAWLRFLTIQDRLMRQICSNSTWRKWLMALLYDEFPREVGTAFSLDDFGLVEGWRTWPLWQLPGNRNGGQK